MFPTLFSDLHIWYQTWGYQFVEVIGFFLLVYAYVGHKNLKLKLNQHELERKVRIANDENELSSEYLRKLGVIGREITAKLNSNDIFETLHQHIRSQLDTSALVIYSLNTSTKKLDPIFIWRYGQRWFEKADIDFHSSSETAARVARTQKGLIDTSSPHIDKSLARPQSILFEPLVVKDETIGVLSIQFSPDTFSERHKQVLQTLCAYTAIALNNANNFKNITLLLQELEATQSKLLGINDRLVAMQSELGVKNEELEHAYQVQAKQKQELERFLAVASHDLRQPMQAVNLYLGAFEKFPLPSEAQIILKNIQQCTMAMDNMFKGLLDLSKLDAKIIEPDIQLFAINDVFARMKAEFEHIAKEKKLLLKIVPCSAFVRSDPLLIEQIFRNLLSNAIRYTVKGKILLGCRRIGDKLRVAVYDTGIGIAKEHQQKIFEEFCQIDRNPFVKAKGLGLGLAIVRRLASLLDTTLTLRSNMKEGSMFALDLELMQTNLDPMLFSPIAEDVQLNAEKLQDKLIVIIDDEASIIDAMRAFLERMGAQVLTGKSGNEFMDNIHHIAAIPDLLVCDFRLGEEINGLDTIQLLREEFNHNIPAIIVTGSVAEPELNDITIQNVTVLHKPLNAKSFCHEVVRSL